MKNDKKVKTIVLDSFGIAKLCCDVARPRAMLENTATDWESDASVKDDWLFSTAYKVMPWKTPPGSVTVNTDMDKVSKRTLALAHHYQDTFYNKFEANPAAASKYIDNLVKIGEEAKESYLEILKDAGKLNKEIVDYWTMHVIALKTVKTGSGVLTSIFAPAVGNVQGWVTAGIEIVQASTIEQAALVVGKKTAEEGITKGAEKVGEKASQAYFKNSNASWKLALEGNARMDRLARSLVNKKSPQKIIKITRQMQRAEAQVATKMASANSSMAKSRAARLAPRGLAVLFAIPDIIDIVEEVGTLSD